MELGRWSWAGGVGPVESPRYTVVGTGRGRSGRGGAARRVSALGTAVERAYDGGMKITPPHRSRSSDRRRWTGSPRVAALGMSLCVGACGASRGVAERVMPPVDSRPASPTAADPQRALVEATQAVRRGDDAAAISWAEEGLRIDALEESLMVELRRVLVAALARGGPPDRALMEARSLHQDARHLTTEYRRAVGVALDRGEDAEAAALALMSWREVLDDAEPEARYVESRLLARLDGVPAAGLQRMLSAASLPRSGCASRCGWGRASSGPGCPGGCPGA